MTTTFSAALATSSCSPRARSSATRSSGRLIEPARRAIRARDGVWSGKASEKRRRATSGRNRSSTRMTTPTARAETARAPTHHSVPSRPEGGGSNQLRVAVVAMPTSSGKTTMTALRGKADRVRASQHGLDERVEVDFRRRVRQGSDAAMLVVTARGAEIDRIAGLDLGADDYVVKPLSVGELMARVRAVSRRIRAAPAEGGLRFADLLIDRRSREVRV